MKTATARQQDAAGDREPGQGVGADVTDDGGVGEDVERLGHQRRERGDGQPEDLPVPAGHRRAGVGHAPTVRPRLSDP